MKMPYKIIQNQTGTAPEHPLSHKTGIRHKCLPHNLQKKPHPDKPGLFPSALPAIPIHYYKAKEFSDRAVIFISRSGGEGQN